MVACIALVLALPVARATLAAAYGIAVTGTMAITSIALLRRRARALGLAALAGARRSSRSSSSSTSRSSARTSPSSSTAAGSRSRSAPVVFTRDDDVEARPRRARARRSRRRRCRSTLFLDDVDATKPHRVPGTAVFMTSNPTARRPCCCTTSSTTRCCTSRSCCSRSSTEHVPEVAAERARSTVDELGRRLLPRRRRATASCRRRTSRASCARCAAQGLAIEPRRHELLPRPRDAAHRRARSTMARWRKALFAFMSRNARPATAFFGLPPNRVVELGMQIEL